MGSHSSAGSNAPSVRRLSLSDGGISFASPFRIRSRVDFASARSGGGAVSSAENERTASTSAHSQRAESNGNLRPLRLVPPVCSDSPIRRLSAASAATSGYLRRRPSSHLQRARSRRTRHALSQSEFRHAFVQNDDLRVVPPPCLRAASQLKAGDLHRATRCSTRQAAESAGGGAKAAPKLDDTRVAFL